MPGVGLGVLLTSQLSRIRFGCDHGSNYTSLAVGEQLANAGIAATADWVHWYNTHRLYSTIGHATPEEIEAVYFEETMPPENR